MITFKHNDLWIIRRGKKSMNSLVFQPKHWATNMKRKPVSLSWQSASNTRKQHELTAVRLHANTSSNTMYRCLLLRCYQPLVFLFLGAQLLDDVAVLELLFGQLFSCVDQAKFKIYTVCEIHYLKIVKVYISKEIPGNISLIPCKKNSVGIRKLSSNSTQGDHYLTFWMVYW